MKHKVVLAVFIGLLFLNSLVSVVQKKLFNMHL